VVEFNQSTSMSNVLILFSSSQLGGTEKSLTNMAFVSDDVNYTLGTLDSEGPWCDLVRANGFSPMVYGNHNFISLVIKLYQDIKRLNIDVVYVCGLRASFLLRFLLIFIPKTKLIHGVRWNPSTNTLLDKSFRIVETFFSWLVDGWIVNSKVTKTTLLSRCKINKNDIYVIYNGVKFPSNIGSFSERPIEILTVANLNKRKGYIEYLKNISKIIDLVPNIKFVFVGRDDMNGLVQKKIIEYGLNKYVSYEGFHSDLSKYYKRARLFVLPSLWGEGCPTSILEALSYSVPVVAYNIDGIPELINNDQDGLLLDIDDDNGFEKIVKLLNSDNNLSLMGERGRKKIKSEFTIESCVMNHKTAVNKVLSN
jgi:glycosyltransferase involved in cell wall biosynthesis